jgi:hypothetical protein
MLVRDIRGNFYVTGRPLASKTAPLTLIKVETTWQCWKRLFLSMIYLYLRQPRFRLLRKIGIKNVGLDAYIKTSDIENREYGRKMSQFHRMDLCKDSGRKPDTSGCGLTPKKNASSEVPLVH